MTVDLSTGRILEAPHDPPAEAPLWSENYAWLTYDHRSGAGVLLHLGRMPFNRDLWRSTVIVYLPEGRLVVSKAIAPSPRNTLGNGNLTLTCEEPLRRWALRFVGAGRPTSSTAMQRGRLVDGDLVYLSIDLSFEQLTPIWDLGQMASLGETHYEQFGQYAGTITAGGETYDLNCTGYRDHSTGRRDIADLGSHVWTHAYFPSGRGFCAFRANTPDGRVALNEGFVITNGAMTPAHPVEVPTLDDAAGTPRAVTIVLPGHSPIRAEALHSMPLSLGEPNDFFLGTDPSLGGKVMVDCPASFEWDDETGYGWLERSAAVRHDIHGELS